MLGQGRGTFGPSLVVDEAGGVADVADYRGDLRYDRAWRVLLGAGICMFCGQPAVILFTFGTMVPAITTSTGWPAVMIAAAIGPATFLASLLAPVAGRMADRFGVQRVALIGGPAFAAGFVAIGMLTRSSVQFAVLLALTCALGFAATPVIYAQLVSSWFEKRRGLALSLMFACTSLGVAFWSPYTAALLLRFGWRVAYAMVGLSAGALIFTAALFLIRDAPRADPRRKDSALPGVAPKDAFKSGTFWKLAIIFMLVTAALAGTSVNLPILLQHHNLPLTTTAGVISVVGLAMFLGRLLAGVLLDKLYSPYVTAGFTLIPVAGFLSVALEPSVPAFFVLAALIGFGLGAELNAAAYIASRAFGLKAFGAIYGAITLAYGLASAFGPALVGGMLVADIDSRPIFLACIAALTSAALLLTSIRITDLPFDHRDKKRFST
jgi:MFS family permease